MTTATAPPGPRIAHAPERTLRGEQETNGTTPTSQECRSSRENASARRRVVTGSGQLVPPPPHSWPRRTSTFEGWCAVMSRTTERGSSPPVEDLTPDPSRWASNHQNALFATQLRLALGSWQRRVLQMPRWTREYLRRFRADCAERFGTPSMKHEFRSCCPDIEAADTLAAAAVHIAADHSYCAGTCRVCSIVHDVEEKPDGNACYVLLLLHAFAHRAEYLRTKKRRAANYGTYEAPVRRQRALDRAASRRCAQVIERRSAFYIIEGGAS